MTKRKGRRRSAHARRNDSQSSKPSGNGGRLASAIDEAYLFIEQERPDRAVEVLEPLLAANPDDPALLYTLGHARVLAGDIWSGLSDIERAVDVTDDPDTMVVLGGLYAERGLYVHALRILHEATDKGTDVDLPEHFDEAVAGLEEQVDRITDLLNLPRAQVEQGLFDFEVGRRALTLGDFQRSIVANRRAIKRLGEWPPPHNNLAQALAYAGQPKKALDEALGVLASNPRDLQALANAVRFLVHSGRREEAQYFWERLESVEPGDIDDAVNKAEAAANLGEHEGVYRTMKALVETEKVDTHAPGARYHAEFLLAVAEANTGRREEAQRRLRAIEHRDDRAQELLGDLQGGGRGTGWADSFAYLGPLELLPGPAQDELVEIIAQRDKMSPDRFRRKLRRFADRYPQVIQVAEKLILEERQPLPGIDILESIGSDRAYDALRRFALGHAGDDQARLEALAALRDAGEIKPGETFRFWAQGEWREVELTSPVQMPPELMRQSDYAPEVIATLNRAMDVFQSGDVEEAEAMFERVLELDPSVKEAYNNLGSIYARRGDSERAKDMFRKAVEIDPLYVIPVCNLAHFRLDDWEVDKAEELVAPLLELEALLPQDKAFLDFTRAQILAHQYRFHRSLELLRNVLEISPDFEPAIGRGGRRILQAGDRPGAQGSEMAPRAPEETRYTRSLAGPGVASVHQGCAHGDGASGCPPWRLVDIEEG